MTRPLARTEIVQVIGDMRRDPASTFHTEDVARDLGTSPSNFIYAFKQATGVSPLRFRAALRIERAKLLLLATARSVTDVCFEVGYNSVGTFTRTFSAMVGLAPSRLRELARERPDGDLSGLPEASFYAPPNEQDATSVELSVIELGGSTPIIVAGLFHEAVPAGWPIHGRLALGERSLRLLWPECIGRVSLLVAGLSAPPKHGLWMPDFDGVSVYAQCLRRNARSRRASVAVEARLRRLRETDPPVVVALPLLITAQSHDRRVTHDPPQHRSFPHVPGY